MAMPSFDLVSRPVEPMSPSGGPLTRFDNPDKSLSYFGYLGFSCRSDFTKFANDLEFVEAYIEYRRITKFVMGGSRAHMKALAWLYLYTEADGSRLLTDVDSNEDPDDHPTPSSFDAVWEKYGRDETKESEFIGCLLFLVDEEFQRAASRYEHGVNDPPSAFKIANTYAALKEKTGFGININCRVKPIVREGHPLPEGLRSECTRRYGEHVCERWNRIWHCFRMMAHYGIWYNQHLLFQFEQDKILSTSGPFWWAMNATERAQHSRPSLLLLKEAMLRNYGEKDEENVGREQVFGDIFKDEDDVMWDQEQFIEGYDTTSDEDSYCEEDDEADSNDPIYGGFLEIMWIPELCKRIGARNCY